MKKILIWLMAMIVLAFAASAQDPVLLLNDTFNRADNESLGDSLYPGLPWVKENIDVTINSNALYFNGTSAGASTNASGSIVNGTLWFDFERVGSGYDTYINIRPGDYSDLQTYFLSLRISVSSSSTYLIEVYPSNYTGGTNIFAPGITTTHPYHRLDFDFITGDFKLVIWSDAYEGASVLYNSSASRVINWTYGNELSIEGISTSNIDSIAITGETYETFFNITPNVCGGLNTSESNSIYSDFVLNESCEMELNSSITLYDGVTFDGAGYTLTGKYDYYDAQTPYNAQFKIFGNNTQVKDVNVYSWDMAFYVANDLKNVTIDGLDTDSYGTFDGGVPGTDEVYLINSDFHDTILSSVVSSNVVTLTNIGTMLIENNTFERIGNQTYYQVATGSNNNRHSAVLIIGSLLGYNMVTMTDNDFKNITWNSFTADNNSNITFSGNQFLDTFGLQTNGEGFGEDNLFYGQSPAMLFSQGVLIGQSSGLSTTPFAMRYNIFDHMSRGLVVRNKQNLVAYGNNFTDFSNPNATFHNFTSASIYFRSDSDNNQVYDNIVSGNVTGFGQAVLFESTADNNLFIGNSIDWGFINASDYANRIENNTYAGSAENKLDVLAMNSAQVSGALFNVTWAAPVFAFHVNVTLEYSTDNLTWSPLADGLTADYYDWTVPGEATYHVRGYAVDAFGVSDRYQAASDTGFSYFMANNASNLSVNLSHAGTIGNFENLTGYAIVSDPENDTIDLEYEWFVNDAALRGGNLTDVSGAFTVDELEDNEQDVGDMIYLWVRITDGNNTVEANTSEVEVSNTLPTLNAHVSPAVTALDSQDILGYADVADADGQQLDAEFAWFVNDIAVRGGNYTNVSGTVLIDTLLASETSINDDVYLWVRLTDGLDTVEDNSTTVGITTSIVPITGMGIVELFNETGRGVGEMSNGFTANGGITKLLMFLMVLGVAGTILGVAAVAIKKKFTGL